MAHDPNTNQHVRRIVLPSGKAIDIVYFDEQQQTVQLSAVAGDLHVCESCGSEFVYPLEWDEAGPRHWEVTLRCPNCERIAVGVFDQDTVERFDEILDEGTDALVTDLKHIMHANMEDEVGRFVRALELGHIVPDDF
jgi:hypothetical protein